MNADLRRRMEEAIVLSAEDPLRQTVESEVVATGPAARAVWEELLREDELLRRELSAVQVPVGLETRLKALPATLEVSLETAGATSTPGDPSGSMTDLRQSAAWSRLAAALGVAAALLVALWFAPSLGEGLRPGAATSRTHPPEAVVRVARLAAANFAHESYTTVDTEHRTEVDETLSRQLPFAVRVPDLGDRFTLRGGRKCSLDGAPVAFTKWDGRTTGSDGVARSYALYQFVPAELGMRALGREHVVRIGSAPSDPTHALVWITDGRGYVLVSPHDAAFARFVECLPGPR